MSLTDSEDGAMAPPPAEAFSPRFRTLGPLHEFRPDSEDFSMYMERVEIYFAANDVPEGKKVPVFLNAVGGTTYGVLRSLLAPDNPMSKSMAEITARLREHYEPKPSLIAERCQFHKRNQNSGESIATYITELRRLAARCNFPRDYLEDTLRDRFVSGLRSEAIQKLLLTEKELTLQIALEKSQSLEAAQKDTQVMKGQTPLSLGQVSERSSFSRSHTEQSGRGRKPATNGGRKLTCHRCGGRGHVGRDCRFRDTVCHRCGKVGHLAKACRSRKQGAKQSEQGGGTTKPATVGTVKPDSEGSDNDNDLLCKVHPDGLERPKPYSVVLEINGHPVTLEIDTGAAVSVVSERTKQKLFPTIALEETDVRLRTYTAKPIQVLGQMLVSVKYQGYQGMHILYVVEGSGPALLGRDWLSKIRLDWGSIKSVTLGGRQQMLDKLLDTYGQVFQPGLGTMTQIKAHLSLKPDATPVFRRPHTVPYAIREKVGKELDRLEEQGVLRRVDYSEWAAPVVPVPKRDGSIRVCGDYKVTINPHLHVDQYPLPKPSDLFACLTGGQSFTKLDLTAAYQQMVLDEASSKLVTINTHQGLYECCRLPFGVASAPAVFQRAMDSILQGIPFVICYLDDILVSGRTDEEHLKNLEEVLHRLQFHGLRLKRDKCSFLRDSVDYLGHRVDAQGVHTSEKKVKAIVDAPTPRNLAELRSFLGMLNFYTKFLPNLSSLLHPLHQLLKAGQHWQWSEDCDRAFTAAKQKLAEAPVLAHYNPSLPLVLAADASAYGIGAVVSHRLPDGSEQPIEYASRTLSKSECNYAQVEKEALSLVFGIKKFHHYLYGRPFVLVTDHKPLLSILGPKRGIPPLAAARMQRWALLLSAYRYTIEFRPTECHGNADGLSRLPLPNTLQVGNPQDPTVFNLTQLASLPMTAKEVAAATRSDTLLRKLLRYLQRGWPSEVDNRLLPFVRRKESLSVEEDCILWGYRVIIPMKLQERVMAELHDSHPGVVRMKALARSHVWWPNIDREIEEKVRSCAACQTNRNAPTKAPLHPWSWATIPWERIHVDFAGPFHGKMFMVVTDSHSKWPEVLLMRSTTTTQTVTALRDLFARYGIPRQLASDNGPQFTSDEFREFMEANRVKHIRAAPYHPATNGAAERLVQTMKKALKASLQDGLPLEQALAAFLFRYRTTPHATTGVTPSSLFMGRELRTRLDLLSPDVGGRVRDRQASQKVHHDRHSGTRELRLGQSVWARNFRDGPTWVPATVSDQLGPLSYLVQLPDGGLWRRHIDQLRAGCDSPPEVVTAQVPGAAEDDFSLMESPDRDTQQQSRSAVETSADTPLPDSTPTVEPMPTTPSATAEPGSNTYDGNGRGLANSSNTSRRYPTRSRKPPERFS